MRENKLPHRILSARLPDYVRRLEELAEGESLELRFEGLPDNNDVPVASIRVFGKQLFAQQFGDRELPAQSPLSRLLQALAQERKGPR